MSVCAYASCAFSFSLFVLRSPGLSSFLPVCFVKQERKKAWGCVAGKVGRIWRRPRRGNCEPSVLYGKSLFSIKNKQTVLTECVCHLCSF